MSNKKVFFEGRVIRVVTERRLLPNGTIANLEIVEHRGAVLIVPFLSKDKIIILKQQVKDKKDFQELIDLIDCFRELNYSKKRKKRILTP